MLEITDLDSISSSVMSYDSDETYISGNEENIENSFSSLDLEEENEKQPLPPPVTVVKKTPRTNRKRRIPAHLSDSIVDTPQRAILGTLYRI